MKNFVFPQPVKKDDYIGIIAPSDGILSDKEIEPSIKIIERWGLKIKIGKYVYSKENDRFSGLPQEKQEDLLRMIEDDEVKIIWPVYGGYSANDVLPLFNKEVVKKLKDNPKWIIGYSDISLILDALFSFKIASIHGPNFTGLNDIQEKSLNQLRNILFERKLEEIDSSYKWEVLIPGRARGRILATNLDSLIYNLGTKFDPLLHGEDDLILCLEDVFIEKSELLRMMDTVLNHKKAYRIKAIILGRFLGIYEVSYAERFRRVSYEKLIENRIRYKFENVPLVKLEDFGHTKISIKEKQGILRKIFPPKRQKETFISFLNGSIGILETSGDKARLLFEEIK